MPTHSRLSITENRTEAQLIADNDTACCNCAHTFPYSNECSNCEQPNGPFTQRTNWKYGINERKIVACPSCGKEGESNNQDVPLTCPFCGHTWEYSDAEEHPKGCAEYKDKEIPNV